MKKYFEKLNEQQLEAASTLEGCVLIRAGAGSGKTATLVSRVACMIDSGICPDQILLLTFTNKAAREMKMRVAKMVHEDSDTVTACTFHSLCANILRKNADFVNRTPDFNIIDGSDAADAMSISKEDFLTEKKKEKVEYDLKAFPTSKTLLNIYSQVVNSCSKLDDVIRGTENESYRAEISTIIRTYILYKREKNVLDYDDLLSFTLFVLERNENVRKSLNRQYRYVMVDEYQDTNTLQEKLLRLLTMENGNLCVVGDAQQSIYGFRYANIYNILTFDNRYEKCKTIELYENYRSSQEILDLPNAFMKYNNEGDTIELHGQFHGKKPELVVLDNPYDENNFIIRKVTDLRRSGMSLRDIAVIVRGGPQTYGLEIELAKAGIQFKKFGGLRFLERLVIKDILAFLRVSVNDKDELALYRLFQLYPGIGKGYAKKIISSVSKNGLDSLEKEYSKKAFAPYLGEFASTIRLLKTMTVNEQLVYLLESYYPSIVSRITSNKKTSEANKGEELREMSGNIEEAKALYELASKYTSTKKFLDDIILDATVKEDNDDFLNITTIHSAKGLEYDVVFIMDVVEGITPRCKEDSAENSEETRVFYVACTRAKKELYLLVPEYSQNRENTLSHFVNKDDVLKTLAINVSKWKLDRIRNFGSELCY